MDHVFEFVGRFHPLLVHLPIGILLIGILFIGLQRTGRMAVPGNVVNLTLAAGAATAVLSCITGLTLSRTGDYDVQSVQWHQWMGISVAVVSSGLWFLNRRSSTTDKLVNWGAVVTLVLLTITGHLGGSLTHGASYLTAPLVAMVKGEPKPVDFSQIDMDSAHLYADIVKPILQANCYTCHSSEKQKGRLRLDEPAHIIKGGKSGEVLENENPEAGELFVRIRLPLADEDHMPPKERKQLSAQELAWLRFWIETGADFEKPVSELATGDKIQELLLVSESQVERKDIPNANAGEPDGEKIESLIRLGVSVTPIATGNDFLQVNFVSVPNDVNQLLPSLDPLAQNVIWLRLNDTSVSDEAVKNLGKLTNLTRLSLANTDVTDAGLDGIISLRSLNTLNLQGTKVTMQGLRRLSSMENLEHLYLFRTQIASAEQEELNKLLTQTKIEWGGYEVPFLETDTVVVKAPK